MPLIVARHYSRLEKPQFMPPSPSPLYWAHQGYSISARTTFATWGQDQGFAQKVIDMSLAHKEPDNVTAAYLRSELLPPRRKLLDAWGAFATSSK